MAAAMADRAARRAGGRAASTAVNVTSATRPPNHAHGTTMVGSRVPRTLFTSTAPVGQPEAEPDERTGRRH